MNIHLKENQTSYSAYWPVIAGRPFNGRWMRALITISAVFVARWESYMLLLCLLYQLHSLHVQLNPRMTTADIVRVYFM
jgi:hypothetical protein